MTDPNKNTNLPAVREPPLRRAMRSSRLWLALGGAVLGVTLGGLIGNLGVSGRGGAFAVWTWFVAGVAFGTVGFMLPVWLRQRPRS